MTTAMTKFIHRNLTEHVISFGHKRNRQQDKPPLSPFRLPPLFIIREIKKVFFKPLISQTLNF